MLRKILLTLGIAIVTCGVGFSQNATIKGKVLDKDGKTPLDFATVRLMQGDEMVLGTATDLRGEYSLSPVPSGKYDVKISFVGYQDIVVSGVEVKGSATRVLDDIVMGAGKDNGTTLKEFTITDKKGVIDVTQAGNVQTRTSEDLDNLVGKGVGDVVGKMAGVTVDAGGNITVRANRQGPTLYVDGAPARSMPSGAMVENFSLLAGAIPAEYGDANAVLEVETKGPANKTSGDVRLFTYVDGNISPSLDANFFGPIVKKKDKSGKDRGYSIGYRVGLTGGYDKGYIVRGGYYCATDETIDYLKENPLRPTLDGRKDYNINYVTKYQEGEILSLGERKPRQLQNAWSTRGGISPRIDIRTKSVDLAVYGRIYYSTGRNGNFANTLFNSDNNSMSEAWNWEANVRFMHRLGVNSSTEKSDGKENKSIFRNAFYRLMGWYMRSTQNQYSATHRDRLFDYGHVGTFKHEIGLNPYTDYNYVDNFTYSGDYLERRKNEDGTYEYIRHHTDGEDFSNVFVQGNTPHSLSIDFTPSDKNPALARYTSMAYERYGNILSRNEAIEEVGGLLNGQSPGTAYGLFNAPGVPSGGVSKSISDRIGGRAIVSFEIRNHAFRLGFDFDQTVSRSHSAGYRQPVSGLWTRMRELTNTHISELDTMPIFELDENGNRTNYINFDILVDSKKQSTFDKNIRQQLGKGVDEWIDIDSYDPSTFSLGLFSAEELLNNGNEYISYAGFDYTGKHQISGRTDVKNWFNEKDEVRRFEIGANKPIKMAAFIQDKFTIKSLFVQVGLRLDIFNSNQPYVKDMFLYRDAYTLKEAMAMPNSRLADAFIPDFSKAGYENVYVYVKEYEEGDDSPLTPIAFRSGKTWYDKNGNEVTDPNSIAKEEGINQLMPYLKSTPGKADISKVNYDAFANYSPTWKNGGITLSPRASFSFIVGEKSVFTASYNVVTNGSIARYSFNPVQYMFLEQYAANSRQITNPALKPERSIDYEITFKQEITKNLGLEFGAYYSEKRDQVVAYMYNQAYPTSYLSLTNMDFGTVQGFMFGLMMRTDKRVSFDANYTLQFARGTGSDVNSTVALLRSGAPNLRTLTSLDVDQRHTMNFVFTYQFTRNDGPKSQFMNKKTNTVKEIRWLENTKATLSLGAGSGTPYTRSSVWYSQVLDNQGQRVVEGSINGSRKPWTMTADLGIQKHFLIALKKKEDGKIEKSGTLAFGLSIDNIFGFRNVDEVYNYSGSPIDDGFLTAKEFKQFIEGRVNPASFIDYYSIAMEGLNRYGHPRTFKFMVQFFF